MRLLLLLMLWDRPVKHHRKDDPVKQAGTVITMFGKPIGRVHGRVEWDGAAVDEALNDYADEVRRSARRDVWRLPWYRRLRGER